MMQLRISADHRCAVALVLIAGLLSLAGCGGGKSEPTSDEGSTNKSSSETWTKSKSDAEGTVYKSDGSNGQTKKNPARDLSKVMPDFTLTSEKFAAEYMQDKNAAEAKYKGKVVELSGRIVGFGQNIENTHYLQLHAKGIGESVLCLSTTKNPWLKATPGQTVKLRGEWPASPFTATLINCHITGATDDPCPKLTAEQVAKAYETEPKKAKSYRDAPACIMEGVIAKKETEKNGRVTVELKHAGKCRVSCTFTPEAKDQTKSLGVGQKIQVIGQTKYSDSDETKFSLVLCVLIEK